jgi:Zn-dependent protease
MNPNDRPNTPDDRSPSDPPVYPTQEYYQQIAEDAWKKHDPPPGSAARGIARPDRPQRLRTHNSFSRFVVRWGGYQRFWIMIGSALLSVLIYTSFFQGSSFLVSLEFGAGFVLLILVHELGHAFALRLKRLPPSFPIFIPGMGAFVTLPNQPISLRDDAEISLAGPFLGGIGSLACLIVFAFLYWNFNDFTSNLDTLNLFYYLAYFGFFINLINLIPLLPLDGGHVGRTLSRWMGVVGLVIIGLLYLYHLSPFNPLFLLLIGIIGLSFVVQDFNSPVRQVAMRQQDQVSVAVMYGLLALVLAGFTYLFFNHDLLLQILNQIHPATNDLQFQ